MPDRTRSREEERLLRRLAKTSAKHELLEPNDRILVAISGGKDSYTMLHLLDKIRERLEFKIDLVAVHLDQQQPGYDGTSLRTWLDERDYKFEILREDTYSVVTDHVEEGQTYCSLCSRLRRGILYTAAERLECNKIALGHHLDDTIETMLMNLFYAGKIQAMPARYTTDDGRFQVIRPLIEIEEKHIEQFAEQEGFPIIPCNLCGSQPASKRQAMSDLVSSLEVGHPHVRRVMLNALGNIRPTHLLDRDLLEAWEARPEHLAGRRGQAQETETHFAAESTPGPMRIIP